MDYWASAFTFEKLWFSKLLVSFPIMLLISIYPNLLPVKYMILLQLFSLSNTNFLQHFAVPASTFLRYLAAIKLKTSSFEIYIFFFCD